jgi:hypothetical protein
MTLLICLIHSDTNDRGEEDSPLTVGILFSLDRCLLMGDPVDPQEEMMELDGWNE